MSAGRLLTFVSLLILVSVSLCLAALPASAGQTAVVQTAVANLRQGPATTYAKVGEAYKGERLAVLDTAPGWYKVSKESRSSWIYGELVRIESTAPEYVAQTKEAVTLRSGPGNSHTPMGSVPAGTDLKLLGKSGQWVKVQTGDGRVAWVAGWLVDIRRDTPSPDPAPGVPSPAPTSSAAPEYVAQTKGAVTLRSGPGNSHAQVGGVPAGTDLKLLGKSGQWVKVQTGDGRVAWVAGWLVNIRRDTPPPAPAPAPSPAPEPGTPALPPKPSAPPDPPASGGAEPSSGGDIEEDVVGRMAQVAVDVADLRGGPAATYRAVASASRGSSLPIVEVKGGWLKVRTPGGTVGWVDRSQVNIAGLAPPSRGDAPAGESLTVKAETGGSRTRVIIETPTAMGYGVFILRNPDRVVFDITGVPQGDLPSDAKVNSKTLGGLRFGWQTDPDRARIVCDLRAPLSKTRYKARLSSDRRTLVLEFWTVSNALQDRTVVLDAGHGGSDPGAIGATGLKEKDVTLAIVLETARLLEQRGVNVVLTRDDDRFVDLYERAAIANAAAADLFVSVHCNSHTTSSPVGTETYYCAQPDNAAAAGQAEERARLAQLIHKHLLAELQRPDRGVKTAGFAVIRATDIPSVLAEAAFISNPEEESLLARDDFRRKAAGAVVDAILEFLED
ncbi:MAG: N-acetylmuramoyl-L-alanine amidase [Thermoanaerobacterales bacterium]|nr:N-acetylmuramoyl-L-alanine amidase [Thermoanaerobacterales bacterium]